MNCQPMHSIEQFIIRSCRNTSFLFCTCMCHVDCFVMLYCPHVCISCHTYHYKVISSLKQNVYIFQHHTHTFSDPALVDLTRIQNNTTSNMLFIFIYDLSMWNIALLMTAVEDGILSDLYTDISWGVCDMEECEMGETSPQLFHVQSQDLVLYSLLWPLK